MGIRSYRIKLTLEESDFEMSMGRKPKSQNEFEEWAYLFENSLRNEHIDWNILCERTRKALGRHRSQPLGAKGWRQPAAFGVIARYGTCQVRLSKFIRIAP